MKHRVTNFDPADYLDNDEMIAGYLSDALETLDPEFVADSIGVIARAKGLKSVSKRTDVGREGLSRNLSATGNPSLGDVLKILASLEIRLAARPVADHSPSWAERGLASKNMEPSPE